MASNYLVVIDVLDGTRKLRPIEGHEERMWIREQLECFFDATSDISYSYRIWENPEWVKPTFYSARKSRDISAPDLNTLERRFKRKGKTLRAIKLDL